LITTPPIEAAESWGDVIVIADNRPFGDLISPDKRAGTSAI
jgi:hypothetical protein